MSTSPPTDHVAANGFVCDCQEWFRLACAGEQFYRQREGKRYCVLHFPSEEKSADFKHAIQRKIDNKDFDFRGVWFPDDPLFVNFDFSEADFSAATFSAGANFSRASFNARVYFTGATFSGETRFVETIFSGAAYFDDATFSNRATFLDVTFSASAHFLRTTFIMGASFREVSFGGATDFSGATLSGALVFDKTGFKAPAVFSGATFEDHVRFAGRERHPLFNDRSSLDLQFARIEKPEHLSFHTLTLRPYWFVNVDARKFEFTNIEWHWQSTQEEILSLQEHLVSSPHRMLAIACRHLAVNAEENHRYEEASKFRYMAMDARRLEHFRGFDFRRLSWWYWVASGYGERVLRATVVLLGILLLSAALYTRVGFARWESRLTSESNAATTRGDETGAPLKLSRALTYSAAVMTFQRPEPRPATTAAQTIVLLETIFGPVQAALLALAIRRKFMR